jgi:hypothetical protein
MACKKTQFEESVRKRALKRLGRNMVITRGTIKSSLCRRPIFAAVTAEEGDTDRPPN